MRRRAPARGGSGNGSGKGSRPNLGRWRKVFVRTWGDEKFRRLSRPAPSAQFLWVYLLTNPSTNSIPGLFRIGEAQLADELGWSMEPFRERFRELFREGMAKADWSAHVLWIPKAIEWNPPDNPNVVKGWLGALDEIPECALKTEAFHGLAGYLEGLGEPFVEPFRNGYLNRSPKGYPNRMPNKEQEQEQDLEEKIPLSARAGAGVAKGADLHVGEPPVTPALVAVQERLTAFSVRHKFAAVRSRVYDNASFTHITPPDTKGKISEFVEALTPAQEADVERSMEVFWRHVRAGDEDWTDQRLTKSVPFAFGTWMSRLSDLIDEIHERQPKPPTNGHNRDIKRGMVHYDENKPAPQSGTVKL
jgi:hypothetical protein